MEKISISDNILKNLFKNVYFINGTAYAGKSTMVKMLAQKHNGIACNENYHEELNYLTDVENQPNIHYFETMKDWQEFVNRSPQEYFDWIKNSSNEVSELEIIKLIQLAESGKKIFVDTNISPEVLHQISTYNNVAIMVCPQSMSVEKFFDREDPEKQFILSKINEAKDPQKTMANFKACLEKINSKEQYDYFLNSGFFVFVRDNTKTLNETLEILEKHFKLK